MAVVGVLLAGLNSCYLILMEGTCFGYQNKVHAISYILVFRYSRAKSKKRKLLIPHPVEVPEQSY